MVDKTVDLNADADTKDSEFIGISEAVTETGNSMTIDFQSVLQTAFNKTKENK